MEREQILVPAAPKKECSKMVRYIDKTKLLKIYETKIEN